jgi:Rieske Fe-S protein
MSTLQNSKPRKMYTMDEMGRIVKMNQIESLTPQHHSIWCQHIGCNRHATWREGVASLTGTFNYFYCDSHIGN